MTFLNVSLAIGACACVIPLVIHLLNRRRHHVIRWGAMHLISPIVRTNRRRVRLEQWILLLMRMAILALLALAMAGPVLTGWHALSGNAMTSLALLFDNSYSMDAGAAGATNFELAKRNAAELIEHQRRGSDVSVALMAGGEVIGSTSPTTYRKKSANEIRELPSGFGGVDVTDSFERATRSLIKMQHAKRDLVIVSDFQERDWAGDASPALQKATDLIDAMPLKPTITLMQIGTEAVDNVSIQSIEITPRVVAIDQRVSIRVNIRNHSDVPYPDLRVNLTVNGKDQSSDSIDLAAKEDGQLLLEHRFAEPGSHVIAVRAQADSLQMDNSYLAVVEVWDRLPVLLVDGDPQEETLKSETGFLQLALSPFLTAATLPEETRDETLPRADLLDASVIPFTELTGDDLREPRVVVLANVPKLTDEQLAELKTFVREGHSLLVFPGDRIDAPWYRTRMGNRSELASMTFDPIESRAQVTDAKSQDQPIGLKAADAPAASVGIAGTRFEHPVLDLFNDSRNGSLSDSKIRVWQRLSRPSGTAGDDPLSDAEAPNSAEEEAPSEATVRGSARILARLDNGDPFLVENTYGKGRVIVCATTCDDAWNNLPSRPFYLPLMQRLVTYLATVAQPRRNLTVGQTLVAQVKPDAGTATLTRPDGKQVELPPRDRGQSGVIEYGDTDQEGLYTLLVASEPAQHYAVLAPRSESELKLLDDDQLTALADSLEATVVRSTKEFIEQDSTRRYGREIWRHLYWAMLCLVVGEILLEQVFSGVPFRQSNQES